MEVLYIVEETEPRKSVGISLDKLEFPGIKLNTDEVSFYIPINKIKVNVKEQFVKVHKSRKIDYYEVVISIFVIISLLGLFDTMDFWIFFFEKYLSNHLVQNSCFNSLLILLLIEIQIGTVIIYYLLESKKIFMKFRKDFQRAINNNIHSTNKHTDFIRKEYERFYRKVKQENLAILRMNNYKIIWNYKESRELIIHNAFWWRILFIVTAWLFLIIYLMGSAVYSKEIDLFYFSYSRIINCLLFIQPFIILTCWLDYMDLIRKIQS